MADPILFIIRFQIKQGKAEDFRNHYLTSIPSVKAGKPGTLVQLAYENENTGEVSVVRLFSSAETMDQHLQGSGERSKKTYEFVAPLSIEIHGRPNASTLEKMKHNAGPGIAVSVNPRYIGGFIRQNGTRGHAPSWLD